MKYSDLSIKDKRDIINRVQAENGLNRQIIEVSYQPSFEDNPYIRSKVIIEVSGRSMNEPVIPVSLRSFMDEVFTQTPFTEPDFEVRAVAPQRTFLEKVFLLHEEFSKPKEHIRTERMSRHLYDIGQMMNFPIAEEALNNKALYISVIEHRKTFIGLKGFDYQTLYPKHSISFFPKPSMTHGKRITK